MEQDNKRNNTSGKEENAAVNLSDRSMFFEKKIAAEYITTRLAAEILGISESALRIKVCRGQVPVHRLGRSLRFRISEITQLFKHEE